MTPEHNELNMTLPQYNRAQGQASQLTVGPNHESSVAGLDC